MKNVMLVFNNLYLLLDGLRRKGNKLTPYIIIY